MAGLGSSALGAWFWLVTLILVVLGLVVGFLNIGEKEVNNFLIAAIAVVSVGTVNLGVIPDIGTFLMSMVQNVAAVVAPAALVVAWTSVHTLARKPS